MYLDAAGAQRDFRTVQQAGTIIEGENYVPVATEPKKNNPSSPSSKTLVELQEARKATEKADIIAKKDAMDKKYRYEGLKAYYRPQEHVESPKFTAVWQRKEAERREKRREMGMSAGLEEINGEKLPDPTMRWVASPRIDSQKIMKAKRKTDIINE